jgi:hypothetical protein
MTPLAIQSYILGGAYTRDGAAGVDTGLQYTNAKKGYNSFFAGANGGISGQGGTLPCGGLYGIAVTIMADPNNSADNTFTLNDSYTDPSGGNPMNVTLMGDVSKSNFDLSGNNWVIRRCTCFAQPNGVGLDGSWFGFAPHPAGSPSSSQGPNLSVPAFAYDNFQVSGPAKPTVQVNPTIAFADRNPPDANTTVLC